MTRIRFAAFSLAAAALLSVAGAISCSSQKTAESHADPAAETPVQRGEYLVTIAGCNDCHTPGNFYGAPDMDRRLSGSELGWAGPWGVAYPRNLTPDPETGLGKWTDDQIITAIRAGMRPDGRQLAPFMPWMGFSHLTDDDAAAIVAYLRSLKPVVHKVPDPLPPGTKPTGAVMVFPPPPAWDAPKAPPSGN